jgi:hypothetical protein
VILPEDACWGLTPHRAAKEASLRSRSGLSPAVMSRAAALSGPTPRGVSIVGMWLVDREALTAAWVPGLVDIFSPLCKCP